MQWYDSKSLKSAYKNPFILQIFVIYVRGGDVVIRKVSFFVGFDHCHPCYAIMWHPSSVCTARFVTTGAIDLKLCMNE
jgi:hypothetical protein